MGYGNVSITTGATLIAVANPARRGLTIVNNSQTTVVYIGPDTSITTTNAIPLYENQTTHRDSNLPEGYKGSIYGIVGSGTADVRYWENVM